MTSEAVLARIAQHDEIEPNLKKNPPQKRNMGFGSYCHVVSPTNLKKSDSVAPL